MAKPYYFPLEATLCLVFPASDHQLWSQCVVCVHGSGAQSSQARSERSKVGARRARSLDSGPALHIHRRVAGDKTLHQ